MNTLLGIVSKNRASILPKAIDSAIFQDYKNLTVAVFDDNSSDNTRTLQTEYPMVQWEFSTVNLGYLHARNKWMMQSCYDYFCSLDDDSWFLAPTSLSMAITHLNLNRDVAAIAFDILSPDKSNVSLLTEPFETNTFIGCGHVVRLSAAREVNFYEPNPGYYGGEEKDLCIKLIDRGYKIVFMPGVHVWHDKTLVARDLKNQHRSGVCNDLVFTYRRTPSPYLIPALCLKLLQHFRFAYSYKQLSLLPYCMQGFKDFFKLALAGRLNRKPVKNATVTKFQRLGK